MNLKEFRTSFQAFLDRRPRSPILGEAGQGLVRELLQDPCWFGHFLKDLVGHPAFLTDRSLSVFDNEIKIYRSPDKSFTLLAYAWENRELSPIHDHSAWGIIGALIGPLREIRYRRLDDGRTEDQAEVEPVSDQVLELGQVGTVLPLNKGIHQTGAVDDRLTVTLGLYGQSMRPGYINFFDPGGNRVIRTYKKMSFRKVLVLRTLTALEDLVGQKFLTPALLESLPADLVKEFYEGSSAQ